jgi:hypothetical protein
MSQSLSLLVSPPILLALLCCTATVGHVRADEAPSGQPAKLPTANHRRPANDDELRYWLQNMVWYHQFTIDEVTAATGMDAEEVRSAMARFDIRSDNRPGPDADAEQEKILVLPYPGGRHPRAGHHSAAIRPQREAKISIFAPWDDRGYVVIDVPEAIDSDLGLLYLAHTHVPTYWTRQNIELERLEWNRHADGSLDIQRRLPSGVSFSVRVKPSHEGVRMFFALTNGTDQTLTQLRMNPCVMLNGAVGFEHQTNENKILRNPFAACRSVEGDRWIITAWDDCLTVLANPSCPCMHSHPTLPECAPGQTVTARGWLSFYEGTDIDAEFRRLDAVMYR